MSVDAATGQQSRILAGKPATYHRLAGVGGLIFAASLVADNLVRAKAPGFGAGPAQVTAYFLHNRAAALIPLGLFPATMLAFFVFVAAVWTTADRDEDRWWASAGVLGAATIAALFSLVNVTEIVITAQAAQLAASPAVAQALWALHAAAFGLDMAAIGATLIALSRAAAAARLIPAWFAAVAWPGAACLIVASVFTVALVNGGPWLAVGLVGFFVWLVFVVAASISLLRGRRIPSAATGPA